MPTRRLGSPVVDGELDEVVVGIAEVNAGRRTARARAWSGSSLWHHAVTLQQSEDVVDGPVPFETEVGAPHRWLPRSEVARDNDPVVDALNSQCRLPPPLPRIGGPTFPPPSPKGRCT